MRGMRKKVIISRILETIVTMILLPLFVRRRVVGSDGVASIGWMMMMMHSLTDLNILALEEKHQS